MGYYIETGKSQEKAKDIVEQFGAIIIPREEVKKAFDEGWGIVCVVNEKEKNMSETQTDLMQKHQDIWKDTKKEIREKLTFLLEETPWEIGQVPRWYFEVKELFMTLKWIEESQHSIHGSD